MPFRLNKCLLLLLQEQTLFFLEFVWVGIKWNTASQIGYTARNLFIQPTEIISRQILVFIYWNPMQWNSEKRTALPFNKKRNSHLDHWCKKCHDFSQSKFKQTNKQAKLKILTPDQVLVQGMSETMSDKA